MMVCLDREVREVGMSPAKALGIRGRVQSVEKLLSDEVQAIIL